VEVATRAEESLTKSMGQKVTFRTRRRGGRRPDRLAERAGFHASLVPLVPIHARPSLRQRDAELPGKVDHTQAHLNWPVI